MLFTFTQVFKMELLNQREVPKYMESWEELYLKRSAV